MKNCKICGKQSTKLFDCIVLKKYSVGYYKCSFCGFIETEMPYWLDEAYSSAITSLDIGLTYRNMLTAPILEVLIKSFYSATGKFVDYGGGYGMLVRMMRDKGFDFYRQDIYCENVFSKNFDVDDCGGDKSGFELITAFEVFEHLVDPVKELELMLQYGSDVFFSTTLYPVGTDLLNWWYLIPETGQHVSLYSKAALEILGAKFGLNYRGYANTYHLFTKKDISQSSFERIFKPLYQKLLNKLRPSPASLLGSDFNKISGIKM